MNKRLIIGMVVLIAIIVGFSYLSIDKKESDSDRSSVSTYSNSDIGIKFDYKTGPSGYVIEESNPADPKSGLFKSIVLIQSNDAERAKPVEGEGPATITIQIFKNSKKLQSLNWANENTQYSNINLKTGNVSETVVGGANAIRYMADGLYASENFVVTHGGNVYMISGMFISEDSDLRRDFMPLVNSVQFIPQSGEPTVQGKINIDAVCEGVLAYMTFPDGNSADLYVKECKEGKHPEVIERFKRELNIGDDAAI